MKSRRLTIILTLISALLLAFADAGAAGTSRRSLHEAADKVLNSPKFRNLRPLKRRPRMFRGNPGDMGAPPSGEEFLDPENGEPVIERDHEQKGRLWRGEREGRAVIGEDKDGREVFLREDRENGKDVIVRDANDERIVRDEKKRPIVFRDDKGRVEIEPDRNGRAVIGRDENNNDVRLKDGRGRDVIVKDVQPWQVRRRDGQGRPVEIRDDNGRPVRIRDEQGNPIVRRDPLKRPILYRDRNGRVEIRRDENGRAIIGKDEENRRDVVVRDQQRREVVVREEKNRGEKLVRDIEGRPILRREQDGRVPIGRVQEDGPNQGRAIIGKDEQGRDVLVRDNRDRRVHARDWKEMDRMRDRWRRGFRGRGDGGVGPNGGGENFGGENGNGPGDAGGNNGGPDGGGEVENGGGDNDVGADPAPSDSSDSSSGFSSGGGAMGGFFSAFAQILSWLVIAVIACGMVFLIVKGIIALIAWYQDRDRDIPQTAASTPAEDPMQPERSPGDLPADVYIAKAQELAGAGKFREAIAQLLLGGMSNLERSGLVKFRKGLTHRDYVRAIRGQKQFFQSMRAMVRLYEPLGFGRRTPSPEHFEQALAAYQSGFRATA